MEQEDKQTTEVQQTQEQVNGTNINRETVIKRTPTSGVVVFQRVVWYIAGFIIALLVLRIVLLLLGANESNQFVSFIYSLSSLFAAPFFGIFSYQPSYGISTLEVSSIVAIAIYALVAWGLAKLVTLTRPSDEV